MAKPLGTLCCRLGSRQRVSQRCQCGRRVRPPARPPRLHARWAGLPMLVAVGTLGKPLTTPASVRRSDVRTDRMKGASRRRRGCDQRRRRSWIGLVVQEAALEKPQGPLFAASRLLDGRFRHVARLRSSVVVVTQPCSACCCSVVGELPTLPDRCPGCCGANPESSDCSLHVVSCRLRNGLMDGVTHASAATLEVPSPPPQSCCHPAIDECTGAPHTPQCCRGARRPSSARPSWGERSCVRMRSLAGSCTAMHCMSYPSCGQAKHSSPVQQTSCMRSVKPMQQKNLIMNRKSACGSVCRC